MTDILEPTVHRTPLDERHTALGARMIDFAGWLMPVQYAGILEEHRAVRERAGLFDLSHMGELFVEGPDAGAALAHALVTNPPALRIGAWSAPQRCPRPRRCGPSSRTIPSRSLSSRPR